MAYSLALNTVYNQYLTTYAPKKSDTRYDTHKKSELRVVTNSMAKVNKDAPLYKLENSPESNRYIIGIKEETRQLQNTITSIMGNTDAVGLNGKIAYSSDVNIARVVYVGQDIHSEVSNNASDEDGRVVANTGEIPSHKIEVQSLASSQVNMGNFLPKNERALPAQDYAFDLNINGQSYEFQYSVREGNTNFDVQGRLGRLINNSNIGINATVEEDDLGNSALKISSAQVGIHFGENSRVFNITDESITKGRGSVDYFGINRVVRDATNAHFTIDGNEAEASANSFVFDKRFEITLTGVSPEEGIGAVIGVKPDTEAAVEHVNNLIGGYNQFIKAIDEYRESQSGSRMLIGEMQNIAGLYSEQMESLGITVNEKGMMDIDKERLGRAIIEGEGEKAVSSLKQFSGAVLRKSKQISVNPVNYMNKTIVEYKNPGKNFLSPYMASAYAGMMFNSYC